MIGFAVLEKNTMYNALTVSKYIIQTYDCHHMTISNLKLQPILYYIQAEFLVDTGNRCFSDAIEAWSFGAVVPTVYRKYKRYGSAHIPVCLNYTFPINNSDTTRIDNVLIACSSFPAWQLCEFIRHQDPWLDAYNSNNCNYEIYADSIYKYFS